MICSTKLPWNECQRISLMVSQHWFRHCLGAVRLRSLMPYGITRLLWVKFTEGCFQGYWGTWLLMFHHWFRVCLMYMESEYGPVTMIVPASGHQVCCIPWVQMGTFNKEISFLCGLKFFALNIFCGEYLQPSLHLMLQIWWKLLLWKMCQ